MTRTELFRGKEERRTPSPETRDPEAPPARPDSNEPSKTGFAEDLAGAGWGMTPNGVVTLGMDPGVVTVNLKALGLGPGPRPAPPHQKTVDWDLIRRLSLAQASLATVATMAVFVSIWFFGISSDKMTSFFGAVFLLFTALVGWKRY